MSGNYNTRRVRAWNVKAGHELSWFDMKSKRGFTMVVRRVNLRQYPGEPPYVAIDLFKKGAKRKHLYIWRCAKNSLVVIRERK